MNKLKVCFYEFNIRMGRFCYLPIVSGILRAYAETNPEICERYEFMPFVYAMDSLTNVRKETKGLPNVAAFSVSMWNEQLCLEAARQLKDLFGNFVLIVFGGYSVPHHPTAYMVRHPYIDVCVRSEGEETFKAILGRYATEEHTRRGFLGVQGLTYRNGAEIIENKEEWPFVKDLDQYPSPYLTGMFDSLVKSDLAFVNDIGWQAIIETNRGCSFPCSFCAWGRGGTTTRYRFHSMERVKAEIDWCGQNSIPYVFNADANFGMHPRDQEIAAYLVETKKKYGYPDKFRTCFGKNTDDKIFKTATMLHSAGMEKGITLARQSNDETTLKNIRRQNISLATYRNLQERFNDTGIPVYVELILGLPGETLESWKKGIDDCLTKAGSKNSLFVYMCQVLPNTELADPEYQKRFGIRTKRIELQEIHSSPRGSDWVTEYEDIVIATESMPYDDWREAAKFAWATMLLHSMKAGFFVMAWLWDRFKIPPSELIEEFVRTTDKGNWDRLLDRMSVFGEGRGQVLPQYGDIYWDVEEAALLEDSENWEDFYQLLRELVFDLFVVKKLDCPEEFGEIFQYQRTRMPEYPPHPHDLHIFDYNVPEYFDKLFTANPAPLIEKHQKMMLKPKTFASQEEFARNTVLWGRKSGTMLVECTYEDRK